MWNDSVMAIKWGRTMRSTTLSKAGLLIAVVIGVVISAVVAGSVLRAAAPRAGERAGKPAGKPGPSGYQLVKNIPLTGEGGWDYLIADADARRLYVSHATKVVVFDLDSNTPAGEIP